MDHATKGGSRNPHEAGEVAERSSALLERRKNRVYPSPHLRLSCCGDQAAYRSFGDVSDRPASFTDDGRIRLINELRFNRVELNVDPLLVLRAQVQLSQVRSEFGHES